jgi:hypothetical protein
MVVFNQEEFFSRRLPCTSWDETPLGEMPRRHLYLLTTCSLLPLHVLYSRVRKYLICTCSLLALYFPSTCPTVGFRSNIIRPVLFISASRRLTGEIPRIAISLWCLPRPWPHSGRFGRTQTRIGMGCWLRTLLKRRCTQPRRIRNVYSSGKGTSVY